MKQAVEIEVNGLTLRGNLYSPKDDAQEIKSLPAILFIHGWGGKPNDSAADFLTKHGYMSLAFSLSGHNDGDGDIADQTRQKSLQEVLAAYDFLRSQTPAPIVAVGSSYGGYMSALLSAERPLAAMSLRVPANYLDESFNERQLGQGDDLILLKWRDLPLDSNATRTLKAVHVFQGPVQIIEAEFDERIPHQAVQNYVKAVGNKNQLDYHFMTGWPHSIGNSKKRAKQYQEILVNWLDQQL